MEKTGGVRAWVITMAIKCCVALRLRESSLNNFFLIKSKYIFKNYKKRVHKLWVSWKGQCADRDRKWSGGQKGSEMRDRTAASFLTDKVQASWIPKGTIQVYSGFKWPWNCQLYPFHELLYLNCFVWVYIPCNQTSGTKIFMKWIAYFSCYMQTSRSLGPRYHY